MRPFLTLAFIGLCFSLSAQETINYPYNPDGNADGAITVPDLQDLLVNYGNAFAPSEIQIDGVGLAEVISTLQATVEAQQMYITQLQQYISIEEETVLISGANLQVVSGSGETAEAVNGTGNIIIGYDEDNGNDKSGSHNLVVGMNHTYSSYGGIVAGLNNSITGQASSVLGGKYNIASGQRSSVSGGIFNIALGDNSFVSGGFDNTASGTYSSVLGGELNIASGPKSSISGGYDNNALGTYSVVLGSAGNTFLDNAPYGILIE
jgi:hypothetical protein